MPVFRVTKKLATALRVKLATSPVEHANVEHEWLADLCFVDGKKCVIWVHRQTLLTFLQWLPLNYASSTHCSDTSFERRRRHWRFPNPCSTASVVCGEERYAHRPMTEAPSGRCWTTEAEPRSACRSLVVGTFVRRPAHLDYGLALRAR